MVDSDEFAEGTLLDGRFRIERLLGRGGMCTVYEAIHLELERPVAIKTLRADKIVDGSMAERFRREAVALSGFEHPNIAKVFSFGQCEGQFYIVLELLEGETLAEHIAKNGRLSPTGTVAIFEQILSGLEHAHQQGVIHRDMKPSNVMIQPGNQVKLVDFGIAKLSSNQVEQQLTRTGAILGTPLYMSPELMDAGEIDARSDLYSTACMMYEALTGQPPFSGSNYYTVALAHRYEPPPQSRYLENALGRVVLHGLEKAPGDRLQSASEFLQAIKNPNDHVIARKAGKTRKTSVAIALLLGVAAVAAGSLVTFQLNGRNKAPTNYFDHRVVLDRLASGDLSGAVASMEPALKTRPATYEQEIVAGAHAIGKYALDHQQPDVASKYFAIATMSMPPVEDPHYDESMYELFELYRTDNNKYLSASQAQRGREHVAYLYKYKPNSTALYVARKQLVYTLPKGSPEGLAILRELRKSSPSPEYQISACNDLSQGLYEAARTCPPDQFRPLLLEAQSCAKEAISLGDASDSGTVQLAQVTEALDKGWVKP